MIQCGICLEEYQEDDSELHQQMCLVRLMFRCSLCNEDYVNKEGLWNHLDLHEIADEIKELHYQEIKAKHKLHQCVLCNDQRAYSESPYWKHVHDVHDGFFLRCSDCGKNFRSKQLKNDHISSRCETVALEEEQVPILVENMNSDAEHLKISSEEQSSNANEKLDNRLLIDVNLNTANDLDNNIIDKEPELPTANSPKSRDFHSLFVCDNCGIKFSSKCLLLRHKYSCLGGKQQKCPHCRRKFQIHEFYAHLLSCEKRQISYQCCPVKFKASANLANHMRNVHRRKGVLKGKKRDHNQAKNRMETAVNFTEKTLVSSSDSSCSSNVVEDRDTSMTKMDIADRSVQLLVESQSSTSSSTKCVACGKECATANNLRRHFALSHLLTKCSICELAFEGYTSYRYHKIVKHTKPKYECAKCLKKFHIIDRYKRHSNRCDAVQSGELIMKGRSDPKVEPKNPSSEPSHTKCFHCGIKVSSAVTSARHILTHHAAASYTNCSYCGMEESNAVTLARHILMHHDPVACDFCGTTFPSLSKAKHHMKTVHKESTLKCPHCSMLFPSEVRLRKHVSKCENEELPCDFCGKMFKSVSRVFEHKRRSCRAYKRSKEQKQKKAETNLCDETESCTAMEKHSLPLVESGLSQTKCYYCNDESSSPGYLNHHMKIFHKLTKCDICGITVIGISATNEHKMKCHLEPKHIDIQQVVQDRKQVPNNDLQMEISGEETELSARDDQRQSTVNPSSKVDTSNSRSNEHSLANLTDDDLLDSEGIDKESPRVSVAPLDSSLGKQVVSEKTSQSRDKNLSHHPYSCSICGITLHRRKHIWYHMRTRHTEGKFQCPHCSKKFHFKSGLENHASICADLRYSCEFCGQKFNVPSKLENHKKTVHHGCRPLRNTSIEGANFMKEQTKHSVKKKYADRKMISCIICRITFVGTDELMKHEMKCHLEPKHECPTCGSKFHRRKEFTAHSVVCEHKRYLCKLCGHTFKILRTVKRHFKKSHPEVSSFDILQVVQDRKQVPNNDLQMEISGEETALSARDDQGQSTGNPSSKVDTSNSRSNEHSLANLTDDDLLASQGIDKESPMVSVAPSDSSLEKQVVSEKTSQSRDENLSNHPYSCSICGITLHRRSLIRYHMQTRHTEGKFQCPHCSRKFHFKRSLEKHTSICADLRYSCEFCGQKFNVFSRLKNHKKTVHDGSRPLRNTSIEGANFIEEQMKHSVEKKDADRDMISCIICRITFVSTDELMKHKLTCLKHAKEHDDSQFGAEKMSLLHGVKETQTPSSNIAHSENIELELEIKVEETMLQEQEYQVPNEDPGSSSTTTMHPHGTKSKDDEADDAEYLVNGIKDKECIEDVEEMLTVHHITTESTKFQGIPSDRNESLMGQEAARKQSRYRFHEYMIMKP